MGSEDAMTSVPVRTTVNTEAVRDAALTLFAERGYHGTALSEVAELLGIRTPSLYNHMRSKQELLRGIVAETTDQVWEDYEVAVADAEDVVEALRLATGTYALRHATHQREALIVSRDVASLDEPARSQVLDKRRRHEQAIRGLIATGTQQGVFTVRQPVLASFAILEMCVSIARWFRDDGPIPAAEVARQYSDFALQIAGAAVSR